MNNKHFIIVIVVLMVVGGFGYIAYFPIGLNNTDSVNMSGFPKSIGEWDSEEAVFSKRVFDSLQTNNFIMRNYKNKNGDVINLYVIYSQGNRSASLPPEIGLRDEDATITDKSVLQVTDCIKVNKLTIEKEMHWELVFYWYKVGGKNTSVYYKQQLKAIIDRMFGKSTSVALVRISTKIENNNREGAEKKLVNFCILIEPFLNKYVP
jgi:EpsI family protein